MADISDPSTWPIFGQPDQEYLEVIKARGGAPDLFGLGDPAAIKALIAKNKPPKTPTPQGVKEEDRQIPMRDGHHIAIRIHSPEKPPRDGSPLGVIIHGGGWMIGDLESQEQLCRMLVSVLGMTVVNPDYRLSPEYKFPTALHDCYDAAKWAAANASSIGADPSKGFTIGGSSAGGNMSSVISHLWRDDCITPKLTGVHLIVPLICEASFYPKEILAVIKSWNDLRDADILDHKSVTVCMNSYIPNLSDRGEPTFSPLLWKTGHNNLPPHLFQISGMDPVRDEALVYDRILREEAGVKTKIHVYAGQPHGFASLFPNMKASEKFYEDAMNGYRWMLGESQQ